jgi:hypothetical protein
MPFLELFDETLDINSTLNYELSVQVSPEGLAFSILDTIRSKYVLIRSFEPDDNKYITAEKLSDLISKDDFLTKRYKKVHVVMPSPRFTMVPVPLFDPAKKETYFTLNHTVNENEVVLSNKVPEPDSFIVFSALKSLVNICTQFWPEVHPYHHLKPLFNQVSHRSRSIDGYYIHVHVEREFVNMLVYDHNSLKLCNSYNYRNISDIMYYVFNVFKSMGLSRDETIHLSGHTEKYDDLFSNFALYIRHLKFTDPSGNFTFSYVFNDIDLHRFINLFSVTNCE